MLRTPVNTVDTSCRQLGANIKGSLGFIMNAADGTASIESHWFANSWGGGASEIHLASPLPDSSENGDEVNTATPTSVPTIVSGKGKSKVRRILSCEEKRRSRECKVDGCPLIYYNQRYVSCLPTTQSIPTQQAHILSPQMWSPRSPSANVESVTLVDIDLRGKQAELRAW
ncbi:unnamed protein product [Phytophthora fragariaefolia]|uniref:Unnamed protein product n=1 Tax=Phytophthora fragariaefolia TaxID=1490495 RepID=A0A9W7DDP3_9STRA|nr:unnamed protein product [Phytophthora fragariaefolia]